MKNSELRDEFDFSKGVRGKYAEKARGGSNVIRLDDDVATIQHDSRHADDLLDSFDRETPPSSPN